MSEVHGYFTGLADLYSENRPGYPAAAAEWIVLGLRPHARAADVGCGTGISSRLLATLGLRVVGIDPNRDMLEEARRRTPPDLAVEYRAGTGEHTALEDASMDLVLCAQAFHWFDARAALAEFRRVLTATGRLALVWNTADPADPFSAGYARIAARARSDARARGRHAPAERDADIELGDVFTHAVRRQFPNPQPLDWPGLLGRARSASYWPRIGEPPLARDLRALFDAHQAGGQVTLHHITEVTLASPAAGAPPPRGGGGR